MTARASRNDILGWWNGSWAILMETLKALTPADLDRTIAIRKEPFLVIEALYRSMAHMSYHVGWKRSAACWNRPIVHHQRCFTRTPRRRRDDGRRKLSVVG